MRLRLRSLWQVVTGTLAIQFVAQHLTSYSGLELVRRYGRQRELLPRLHRALHDLRSDYGSGRMALLIVALLVVGARRLEHLRYLAGDPLITRFCGLMGVRCYPVRSGTPGKGS